ncbi:cupin domain-containing protein [Tomitella gaofuii]|uniref:cupin domain-containing protein n=1 Tax=Tomitella gaofuii TaxID=2760083 RepID=UPI0015FD698E|nr:cupin domain-containing protein [Tomitella gaofuii]
MTDTSPAPAAIPPIALDTVDWIIVGSGVYLAPLHEIEEGAGTAFLRFDEGAVSHQHTHPAGEEMYVISGKLKVGDVTISAGDYLRTPPGVVHEARALTDAVTLIIVPEPLEFL